MSRKLITQQDHTMDTPSKDIVKPDETEEPSLFHEEHPSSVDALAIIKLFRSIKEPCRIVSDLKKKKFLVVRGRSVATSRLSIIRQPRI